MILKPSSCMSFVILFCHLAYCVSSKSRSCAEGHYYNLRAGRCQKCSTCPTNHIIKQPCSSFKDLLCDPFEFPEFESGSQASYYPSTIDVFLDEKEDRGFINSKSQSRLLSKEKLHTEVNDGPTSIEKDDREYWKTLAFALIGLLSVLIIMATAVVLLACRKLQRVTVIKQPDEGDMDDVDSGYVVIRAIRNVTDTPVYADLSYYYPEDFEAHPPLLATSYSDTDPHSVIDLNTHPSPGRLCFLPRMYTPQRRLLNYDSDDVFEVDDSFTTRKAPSKNLLLAITEKAVSSSKTDDSIGKDHSGVI